MLYSADVVCPMTGPPLRNGGVLVSEGSIAAIGEAAALAGEADRRHHTSGVLLPGLVNGHTHLELTDASRLAKPGPFPAWLTALDGLTATWSDERWARSAHRGVLVALRSGTTVLCDTVTRGPAVPAASRAGLRGDSFVEISGVDAETIDVVAPQVEAALSLPADGRRVGVGLHSVFRLGAGPIQRLAAIAAAAGAPLSVHAAQTVTETAALRGEGPLADQARSAGHAYEWLDAPAATTPIRYLDGLGVLTPATVVVHGVSVDAGEARLLARRGVTVVAAPRANARLGMGEIPLDHYAETGVRMALGTESLAASSDLDVLAEAAAWAAVARRRGLSLWPTPAGLIGLDEAAVRLATVDGARALGWGDMAGRLEPGLRADLTVVDIETSVETVYADILAAGPGRQVLTVLGGVRKARRDSGDVAWPELDDDSWRVPEALAGDAA